MITAEHLTIGYPKSRKHAKTVVHENLSIHLYTGELTCLLGSNGTGKSTLLRTLSGVQPALDGEVLFNSRNIRTYSEQELSCLLGLVLTDKTSVGGLTVTELVGLGRYPYTGFFGKLSAHDREMIEKSMYDVDIAHKSNSYMSELSDGERQKVMIAKALAQECPVIILDEPTAFLDAVNRLEIMNLLHRLSKEQNKTFLLSTHDVELALLLSDRLWLLSKTKGLHCGVTEDIVLSDAINEYIATKNVKFDKETARFISAVIPAKTIHLEAEGELLYWTKNFLSRKGFQATTIPNDNVSVRIHSISDICITENNQSIQLHSFEEFSNWIDNHK